MYCIWSFVIIIIIILISTLWVENWIIFPPSLVNLGSPFLCLLMWSRDDWRTTTTALWRQSSTMPWWCSPMQDPTSARTSRWQPRLGDCQNGLTRHSHLCRAEQFCRRISSPSDEAWSFCNVVDISSSLFFNLYFLLVARDYTPLVQFFGGKMASLIWWMLMKGGRRERKRDGDGGIDPPE